MLHLLPLLPVFILLCIPILMLAIRVLWPRFAYYWLIAALGALSAWPAVLLSRPDAPLEIPLVTWQPQDLFPVSPALLLDNVSWPFALALATLVLAVILTDVARASEADWRAWASSLSITALGVLAVMAANPLTLLLAWVAIDLVELVVLLSQISQNPLRERVIIAFAARMAGILLVIAAGITAQAYGDLLTFATISPRISLYLLLAAGLRLGVLPLYFPFMGGLPQRRGLGTLLRLVPAAASLVLLVRAASAGVPSALSPYLLGLAGLTALAAGVSWATAENELEGRQFWILGMAALAVAAALRAQPLACLAWGISLLLSGGLVFLISARHRSLLPLPLLGLLGFSALPFTPAWDALGLYTAPFSPLLLVFLFAHALLMAGYIGHALAPGSSLRGMERWVWVIYPWGLALLPLTQLIIAWLSWPVQARVASFLPDLASSWPALTALLLGGVLIALGQRLPPPNPRALSTLHAILSFDWFYRQMWNIYRFVGRIIAFINLILEGEGGILWTLLLLTLLLSLLAKRGA